MADNLQQELLNLNPTKDFFVGIDSDGCVFDTMEIKQKECFCPNFIKYFELQKISRFAREAWEFVNLYSKTRGTNRFKALVKTTELLSEREEVKRRNAELPDLSLLKKWISEETKLSNPTLKSYADKVKDETINLVYSWSLAVNKEIAEMVHGIPPFNFAQESIEKLSSRADAIVVSQTPIEALKREWEEHSIDKFVNAIAGQEYGTKKEHLKFAAVGKYEKDKILMVGDAPGDLKAAEENGVLFYPVIPGREEESWERFYFEAIDKFFDGSFAGEYQRQILNEFEKSLPLNPPWRRTK